MTETVDIYTVSKRYDPTYTTPLRNAFAKDMRRRFKELTDVIWEGVVVRDCFGLDRGVHTLQMSPTGFNQFAFMRDPEKVEAFMAWLQEQVDKGLLKVSTFQQIGTSIEAAWTNMYVYDSYKRGVLRARQELQKAGVQIPSIEDSGGIGVVLGTPFHMDRIGLLFTRVYGELKNITGAMDLQISKVLAQGLIDGDGPRLIARKLIATINGTGVDKLGITDTLGRFIPARRRAEMLARTEVIRAHHIGSIQEYRNWAVEGVTVMAEWSTAGDDRVCDKCASLEGKIFTLDEIEPLIPLHPQCFIDYQIPIYTSEGWKEIGKIKIGDYVLTHKGRFRKVYALPRSKSNNTEVVSFYIKGIRNQQLSMTANHPVLIEMEDTGNYCWKEAGKCTKDDKIVILANECVRCKKPIPYFNMYCSHSCLSKDITKRQWSNPEHRKNMSKKTSLQLKKEYALGIRVGKDITKKAHDATRLLASKGLHPFQKPEVIEKNKIATHTPELRKASSERMKKKNPMHDPLIVEKTQKIMKEFYHNNPDRRLNAIMSKHRKNKSLMTSIEKKMSELLDNVGIEYIYQYPILNFDVDFAIPSLKIAIECDGEYWHQDKEKDLIRQRKIENEGWFVLRYSDARINKCLDEVKRELSRVLCNHTKHYQFTGWKIQDIKKWTLTKNRILYNLSVEEDESYIAKGVVVHNCRCIALPYIEDLKKYY